MSRRVSLIPPASVFIGLAVALPAAADGQTIGDYSRAQRALLESTMTQAAARSARAAASASTGAVSGAGPTAAPAARPPARPSGPAVRIGGVFSSSRQVVAQVAVDGTDYVLSAGQGVPGTVWRVEAIAVDRVVLSRREPGPGAAAAEPRRRIFGLPALR